MTIHFCEFCKQVISSFKDCVAYQILYEVQGTGDIGSFVVYIHERCFIDPMFKANADKFKMHAKRLE